MVASPFKYPLPAIIRFVRKFAAASAFLLLAACSKDIQNTEAIRQGILDDLQKRASTTGVDPGILDVSVSSVSFEKDQARAQVSFTPKNMPGGGGMSMNYVLERQGDKWVVKGRQQGALNPHGVGGAPDALPPGHPSESGPTK